MSTDIEKFKAGSPMASTLRMDRMPHIWCPGCGIGSEVKVKLFPAGRAVWKLCSVEGAPLVRMV